MQTRQFGAQRFEGEFGNSKFSGCDIGIGNGSIFLVQNDRGEVVVGIPRQEGGFGHRSRSHHPNHFARKESFNGCIPHLLADRDVIAFFDQPCQIIFKGMIRNASQWHTNAFANGARGENNIKLTSRDLCILIESFVEIAKPKEEDSIRILAFNVKILLSNRGSVIVTHNMIVLDSVI
jgi:hypothetical protein